MHRYNQFRIGHEGLSGLAKVAIGATEEHSECSRCGVKVKYAKGTKWWVDGKWSSKRPPCKGGV